MPVIDEFVQRFFLSRIAASCGSLSFVFGPFVDAGSGLFRNAGREARKVGSVDA